MKDKILNVIMVISILALIGAGYREYLIHNGKLTSDLNANGYSITNLPAGFFPAETDPTVPSWAKEDAPPSETDPTVPAWAKAASAPLPPNYATVSNRAMTALQSFTETDPTVPDWAKGNDPPLPPHYEDIVGTVDITTQTVDWIISTGLPEINESIDITTQTVDWIISTGLPEVESKIESAATAATNYTDAAIGAAIAPANPVFSNAVLSVGLGIDTNTVAVLNALVEAGDELPIGGAATVGGLLLALAAAVAALKRTKADASALRYAMPASVALVAENDAATLVCADRAVTNATIATGFSTLNLTFPDAVSGYVRDFYLRITVAAGESAPAISVPQGVTIENAGGAVPEIADGEASAAATTLVWFSETAPGVFTAKSETVSAVA